MGAAVLRETGMWVCSGRYSPENPRSSRLRARRTGETVRSVRKMVVAIRMASGTSETWDSQGTAFPLHTAGRIRPQVLGIEVEFGQAAERRPTAV